MSNTFSQIAIEISGVSKVYKLYRKTSDRLWEVFSRKARHQEFSSLNDLSFSVHEGECLGVIGENGAGKSTLLKILANTLTPSSGKVVVKGRVGALLELGAGFHPELTGRQNYYLAAALTGLSREEIMAKEEEILAFAEIGDFIDQPVKTYSSGMAVRLGFSIATSVDPDILIIDEALGVGDEYFQKKSMDRLKAYRDEGKTIVLCSHSLYFIDMLCDRVMWLKNGQLEQMGAAGDITHAYGNYQRGRDASRNKEAEIHKGTINTESSKRIVDVRIHNRNGSRSLNYGDDLLVEVDLDSRDDEAYTLGVGVRRNDHVIINIMNLRKMNGLSLKGRGKKTIHFVYPELLLFKGKYHIIIYLADEDALHIYDTRASNEFEVVEQSTYQIEFGLVKMNLDVTEVRDLKL